ncbi:thioredoxin domain-containing protein [Halorubrum sp. N11]|uniref:thioredoxin domain-containing protein n=1 Tax=Halorubrum sp. N11 TaxID=3402276 RepID=UPI003EBE2A79
MKRTRRSLLASAASVGVVGAAGCLGGGGGGDGTDGGDGGDTGGNTLDTGAYDCDLAEPADPNTEFRPVIGDPEADVVVQAFEDFTCGHCATYSLDHFPTIRDEYVASGEIRYEHWDFPIPVNERWAVPVASAARGVGVQYGSEAFFAFAKAAYESQGSYSGEAIGDAAEAAGADPCVAIADAQFATYEEVSASDRSDGVSMGVEGTPTIFVNGEAVEDYRAETIAAAIDEAL